MSKNYSKIIDYDLESTTIQTCTSILNNSQKNYNKYHKNNSSNNNNKNYLRKKIKREKKEIDELETYSHNSYFSNDNIKNNEDNNYNSYLNNEIDIEQDNKKETTIDNLFNGLLNKNYMTYHFELEGHKKHKKF
jgi:hypothetical protein